MEEKNTGQYIKEKRRRGEDKLIGLESRSHAFTSKGAFECWVISQGEKLGIGRKIFQKPTSELSPGLCYQDAWPRGLRQKNKQTHKQKHSGK